MQTKISIKLIYYFSRRYSKYYFYFNNDRSYVTSTGVENNNVHDIIPSEYEYIEFKIKQSRFFYFDSRGFSTCYLRLLNSRKERQKP